MSIRVDNIKKYEPVKGDRVYYIGRSGYGTRYRDASILGNPFSLKLGRENCISKYKEYLKNQVRVDQKTKEMLRQITEDAKHYNVVLLCFCKPLACHGDYVKEVVETKLKKEQDSTAKKGDFTYKKGDIFKEDVQAVVNTVNCVGVMGKGIALQCKQLYPDNYEQYKLWCKRKKLKPGKMCIHTNTVNKNPKYIINFPTKRHWKEKSKREYILDGLNDLVASIKDLNIKSIAIPPLGCGNGGLQWEEVKQDIEKAMYPLKDRVDIRIFEP